MQLQPVAKTQDQPCRRHILYSKQRGGTTNPLIYQGSDKGGGVVQMVLVDAKRNA